MTIKEYLEASSSLSPYYKDCQVVEVSVISPHYALITLRLPMPIGGNHQEIVALDAIFEFKEA